MRGRRVVGAACAATDAEPKCVLPWEQRVQLVAAVRARLSEAGELAVPESGVGEDADAVQLGSGLAGDGAGDLAAEAQLRADSGSPVAGPDCDDCPAVVVRGERAVVVLVDLLQPVRAAQALESRSKGDDVLAGHDVPHRVGALLRCLGAVALIAVDRRHGHADALEWLALAGDLAADIAGLRCGDCAEAAAGRDERAPEGR